MSGERARACSSPELAPPPPANESTMMESSSQVRMIGVRFAMGLILGDGSDGLELLNRNVRAVEAARCDGGLAVGERRRVPGARAAADELAVRRLFDRGDVQVGHHRHSAT